MMSPLVIDDRERLRAARREQEVVATDRVADHLHEHVHVEVVELRVQTRLRERVAHQRAGDRGIEPSLDPVLELPTMEGQEVRALLALDVDDLDVLALAHLVGQRGGLVDAEVEPRLGQGRRQQLEAVALDGAFAEVELGADGAVGDGRAQSSTVRRPRVRRPRRG